MRFSELVPMDTPWQKKLSECVDKVLTLYSAEPIKTQYGPSFLCEVEAKPAFDDLSGKFTVLIGNTVCCDQIDKLLVAFDETGEDFPVDVLVVRVDPGKGSRKYFMFADPEDTNEAEV